jgi:heme/copper-type cytochrome/quinol oxidase subunit 4
MPPERLNRISARAALVFSLLALLMVLSGYLQPPQADEGAAAHIFQICIVALIPTLLMFFTTANWKEPRRSVRTLMVPAASLVIAFGALYYLEHYR